MIWVQNPSSVPQTQALCLKTKANYPRIRHKPNNAKSYAFCSFCVFAGKNAVYLANQSCKDGKSKALCHKPKLCATKTKQTIQEFGTSRILVLLCLCREKRCLFGKSKLQRRRKQSSVPQNKALCHKTKLCAMHYCSVPCIIDIFFLFCRLIMFFH